MQPRLCGGTAPAGILLGQLVGHRIGAAQLHAGQPSLVQQPLQLHICPEVVVAHLRVVVEFLVGVCLRVVATHVSRHSGIEREGHSLSHEDVHIVQREDVALVGGVGRGDVRERTRMLHRCVEHAAPGSQVEALAHGQLPCVLVEFPLHNERRLASSGLHFHHAVAQVAIFHRGDARHHLYALNVGRREGTRGGRQGLAGLAVVVQSHAVHFDGGAKGGVAFLLTFCPERQTTVVHQCGVHRLSTGQQRRYLAHIEQLLLVECGAVDAVGCGGHVVLALRHHSDLVELEACLLQPDGEGLHALLYI